MISSAPFCKLMEENNWDIKFLSQITAISEARLARFSSSDVVDYEVVDCICKIFKLQPCDVIEYRKDKQNGYWEFISEGEKE